MRDWFPRRARISAAVFGCLLLVLIGVVGFVHYQDNRRSAQTVRQIPPPPVAHRAGNVCDLPAWSPSVTSGRGGRVTVDAHPSGAVVYWMPGLNSTACHVIVTKLTETEADSIAQDVRSSVSRGGTFSCPMDDDSAAWIFFQYTGRQGAEVVKAELSGCTTVDAPGRGAVGPFWRGADRLGSLRPARL